MTVQVGIESDVAGEFGELLEQLGLLDAGDRGEDVSSAGGMDLTLFNIAIDLHVNGQFLLGVMLGSLFAYRRRGKRFELRDHRGLAIEPGPEDIAEVIKLFASEEKATAKSQD